MHRIFQRTRLSSVIRFTLIFASLVIFSTVLGANGCLWNGNSSESHQNESGSSGALNATNPNPANNSPNIAVNARLSWSSVAGITSYDIYLGLTSSPVLAANVPNSAYRTCYTPAFLNYGTKYYWRVDSINTAGTNIGTVWNFTTKAQTDIITYASPANGAVDQPINVSISWNSVPTASYYNLYFGNSNPPAFAISHTDTTYNPANALTYYTIFYWKVAAINSGKSVMLTGPVWNFRTLAILSAPASPSPADGAINSLTTTMLSWASGAAATSYNVYLNTSASFGQPKSTVAKIISRTYYNPGGLTANTKYFWQVATLDGVSTPVTGPIWTFITRPDVPGKAEGTHYPALNEQDVPLKITMTWTAAIGATSYDIYLGLGTNPAYKGNTKTTSYSPITLAYDTNYCWRVNPRNISGVRPGDLRLFKTMRMPLPGKPAGSIPYNGTTNCQTNTKVSWLSTSDATSYKVYFGTLDDWLDAATAVAKSVYRTHYDPGTLQYATTYYWRVDALNANNIATIGNTWHFKTRQTVPSKPTYLEPISGTLNCPINQTLVWATAYLADSYDIYLGDPLSGTLGLALIESGVTLTHNTQPTTLSYSTLYFWRIDAKNSNGITVGDIWTFTTLTAPAKPSYIEPINGSMEILTIQQLRWQAAAQATSYRMFFGTSLVNNEPPFFANTTKTSSTPTLSWGITYYWRVDAVNPAGTTNGDVWTFTTLSEPEAVAPPMYPDNGAVNIPLHLSFSWTAATRAEFYNFSLDTASPPAYLTSFGGQTTTYAPGRLAPDTIYYWRVDSQNIVGALPGPEWNFRTKPDSPPEMFPPGDREITENQELNFYISATDPDRDTVSYSTGDLPAGASFNTALALFSWTPNFNQAGVYAVTFTAEAFGLSDSKTITIKINNGDQPPILTLPGDTATINEDGTLYFLISAFDPDGDKITYSYRPLVAGAGIDPDTGQFTWIPGYDQADEYAIVFTASSGSSSDDKIMTIIVNNTDRPPALSLPGGTGIFTVNEGELLTFTLSASDPDGDTVNYSYMPPLDGAILNTATGLFRWTPGIPQGGRVYTVTFYASSFGNTDGKSITITVINLDAGPVFNSPGNQTINEGAALAIPLFNYASDPDGDSITYYITGTPTGAALNASTGLFSWVPNFNQSGIYNVTFTAEANGKSASASISITVNDVLTLVLVSPGDRVVNEDKLLAFTLSASDPDGDPITFSYAPSLTGATLNPNTGAFGWTPGYSQSGVYQVTFTATANDKTDFKSITITVTNVNQAPTLGSPGNRNGNINTLLTFSLSATDPDGDALTYTATNLPVGAVLSGNIFSWTPTSGLDGTYNGVTFRATDSAALYSEVIIVITISSSTAPVWTQVYGGNHSNHNYARRNDNTFWTWGNNSYYQLGLGLTNGTAQRPSPVLFTGTDWAQISCGYIWTVAIKNDTTIWSWGNVTYIGGRSGSTSLPNLITSLGSGWSQVAAGYGHTLTLKNDGTIWAWGNNTYGQIGDGTNTIRSSPVQVLASAVVPFTNAVAIAVGMEHSLALKSDGTVWAWGWNNGGQLGDNTTVNKSYPVQMIGTGQGRIIGASIGGGGSSSFIISNSGYLYGCGDNQYYRSGTGTTVRIPTLTGQNFGPGWSIACGGVWHSLGLMTTGPNRFFMTWGRNDAGQHGTGITTDSARLPTAIANNDWIEALSGNYYDLGLRSDGTLWSWGSNPYGNLGIGGNTTNPATPPQYLPQQIPVPQ